MVRYGNGIRGTQKRMIVLKTAESRYFEEAYFLIRREAEAHEEAPDDMLVEANRILRGCLAEQVEKPVRRCRERIRAFLSGLACGAAIGFLVIFLLCR